MGSCQGRDVLGLSVVAPLMIERRSPRKLVVHCAKLVVVVGLLTVRLLLLSWRARDVSPTVEVGRRGRAFPLAGTGVVYPTMDSGGEERSAVEASTVLRIACCVLTTGFAVGVHVGLLDPVQPDAGPCSSM